MRAGSRSPDNQPLHMMLGNHMYTGSPLIGFTAIDQMARYGAGFIGLRHAIGEVIQIGEKIMADGGA